MPNPNITGVENIQLKSATTQVSDSLKTIIVGSLSKVIKTDSIVVCNNSSTPRSISVQLFTLSTTSYNGPTIIADNLVVPAFSTLNILDKDIPIYLPRSACIKAQANGPLDVITSYSVISEPLQTIDTNDSSLIFYIDPSNPASFSGAGGGTIVNDLSSYGRTGTLVGVGWAMDSKTFTFDGINDYITFGTIPTSDPLTLSNPPDDGINPPGFTIIAAVKPDGSTLDAYPRIIEKATGSSTQNGWGVYFQNPSPGNLGPVRFTADSLVMDYTALGEPKKDTWETIVVRVFTSPSTSEGVIEIVYNNYEVNQGFASAYSIPNVAGELLIGAWYSKTGRMFKGNIGPVLVYNKVLDFPEANDIIRSFDI